MSWALPVLAGASVIGGIFQAKAASKAAEAQVEASKASIAEQRRQFDAIQALLSPYTEAGVNALGEQQSLLGLAGPEAQQASLDALMISPQYQTLLNQGEEALLQRAAATGGLRGGNLQNALMQFRPHLLSQLIESQYGKLGGLTSLGQASAAGTAGYGVQTGANIGSLLTEAGQARAGEALATGRAFASPFQTAGALASLAALKELKVF